MKIYFLFFLLILSNKGFSQYDPDKLQWEPDGLTWEDFKAPASKESKFDANTNAGLSFSWGLKNDNGVIEFTYKVKSYFNPYLSWVRIGSDHDYLLKHEQLHFDITELHARKLRKKMSEITIASLGKDPKGYLTRIYQAVEKERSTMQLEYDKDSRHSLDKDGEARWRAFVRAEMLKYEEYNI